MDNRANHFSSAAAVLNAGAEKAWGEVLVFVHQDVELTAPNTLDSLRETGGKVYAIGLEIYHASTGNFDISLGRALSRLGKKHKSRKYLYMTCAEFRNTRMNRAKHLLSYLKHVIHQKVILNMKVPVGHG